MDKLEKIGFTAILSAVFSWLGLIAVPFLMLVALQLIDYATGLVAAYYRNEQISSYRSFQGIAKKVCMWLLIIVGGVLDWLVAYAALGVGIELDRNVIVAVVVCAWLMCSEIISILENMVDIGVKMPPFLAKLAKHIRSKAQSSADIDDKSDT